MTDSSRPRFPLGDQSWHSQRQLVATISLMVVVGIIIAALYLIQTSTTTTTARELIAMNATRQGLENDNEQLHADIAGYQSLPRVMTRAAELGFQPAGDVDIQYIIVDGYRYNRPLLTPSPTPTPVQPAQVYDETFLGWLEQQWDSLSQQFADWRESE